MANKVWNHKEFTEADNATDIIFHKGSGNDDQNNKYFNFELGSNVRAVVIDTDKNISLVSINDETADNALTIVADAPFTRRADALLVDWSKFKLRTLDTNTRISVSVFIV